MTNPWMKRNPYLSLWLSGANTAAAMARSAAMAELARTQAEAARQTVRFWTEVWSSPFSPPRRR